MGYIKQVAACKVKPYELVENNHGDISSNKMDQEEKDDEEKIDIQDSRENNKMIEKTHDSLGAYYMRMENIVMNYLCLLSNFPYLNTNGQKLLRQRRNKYKSILLNSSN